MVIGGLWKVTVNSKEFVFYCMAMEKSSKSQSVIFLYELGQKSASDHASSVKVTSLDGKWIDVFVFGSEERAKTFVSSTSLCTSSVIRSHTININGEPEDWYLAVHE